MTQRWPVAKLGELCEIQRGGSPRPIDQFITESPDGINWIKIGDVGEGEKYIFSTQQKIRPEGAQRSRFVESGDFLLTNSMSFGRPYILRTSGCIHDGWLVLRYDKQRLSEDYLYHALGSDAVYNQFVKMASGAVVKNLNSDVVKGVEIPLPPLPEQRRIAAILDKADALRAKRREALAQLDRLAQSIFVEMFGDPVANPNGWPLRSFNDACPTRLGKMLDQKQQTGQHTRKYLRNANVQWFRFDLSDLLEMDFDEAARETFALRDGDLLICEGGEPGRAAIWRNQIPDCYYQKALHRGRPDSSLAHAEYLMWLLWCLAKRGGLSDHVTSATIAHLTGEKLKAMQIPLPPLQLQSEFVARLTAHDRLRVAAERALTEQDLLFTSLQHRAFCGEL